MGRECCQRLMSLDCGGDADDVGPVAQKPGSKYSEGPPDATASLSVSDDDLERVWQRLDQSASNLRDGSFYVISEVRDQLIPIILPPPSYFQGSMVERLTDSIGNESGSSN